MNKSKLVPVLVIAAIVMLVAYHFNLMPGLKVKEAVVPKAFDLPTDAGAAATPDANVQPVNLPSAKPASLSGPTVHINMWAWNAQMGLIFANGGPLTTQGSLMEKHKVKVQLTRQDDTNISKADQVKFAKALSDGNTDTSTGPQFVIIMGDQAAQHIATMNKELLKLGPEYYAEVAGAVGKSFGEDALWGPQEWKDNPESMRGGVVFGVLREGDWNIGQYFEGQNNLKNNPDERVYDPDAVNWVAGDDYLKIVDQLINGYTETRDVVVNGKRTGQKKVIDCTGEVKCGFVSWTPGDVNFAKKKGGLVRILSTKENTNQMPAVLIGIHKWDVEHRKTVDDLLAGAFEGADQVRNYAQALQAGGQASYALYKEESPAYWVKYYKGTVEPDRTGHQVPLGGSAVMNLADNALLFGLSAGSGGIDGSLFRATYEGFGNIVKQQYPKLVVDFPPAVKAANTMFIEDLMKLNPQSQPELPTFTEGGTSIAPSDIVAKKNWNIQFDTGKAVPTADGQKTLEQLYMNLQVSGSLYVQIEGHTDDVGDPKSNMSLSEARAFAVKEFLQSKAPTIFPEGKLNVQAFGQSHPLVPNTSNENRAKNRRVTIILGTK